MRWEWDMWARLLRRVRLMTISEDDMMSEKSHQTDDDDELDEISDL